MITLEQRIKLHQGDIEPSDNPFDVNWMIKLLIAGAYDLAVTFRLGAKDIDEQANPDASLYKGKILTLCSQILNYERQGQGQLFASMQRVFITLVGQSNYTWNQIAQADWSAWEGFATSNMLKIFENMAGVYPEEKTEYENL